MGNLQHSQDALNRRDVGVPVISETRYKLWAAQNVYYEKPTYDISDELWTTFGTIFRCEGLDYEGRAGLTTARSQTKRG